MRHPSSLEFPTTLWGGEGRLGLFSGAAKYFAKYVYKNGGSDKIEKECKSSQGLNGENSEKYLQNIPHGIIIPRAIPLSPDSQECPLVY